MHSAHSEHVQEVAAWTAPPLPPRARRLLWWEIVALFAVSLGMSAVRSLVSLIGSLTEPESLEAQHIVINGSQAPGRPVFDLVLQLVSIASGVAPACRGCPERSRRSAAALRPERPGGVFL